MRNEYARSPFGERRLFSEACCLKGFEAILRGPPLEGSSHEDRSYAALDVVAIIIWARIIVALPSHGR